MLETTINNLYQQLIMIPQPQKSLIPMAMMNSYSFLIVKITVIHILALNRAMSVYATYVMLMA